MTLTSYERDILDNVARTGCHITCVLDPDDNDPPFAYSTGFPRSLGVGEVIVFGLSGELMVAMINEVHDRIEENMLRLTDGVAIDGLLSDHICVARRVAAKQITREYFNSAMWFARTQLGTEVTEAWQLCWPAVGTDLLPWDADCPADVRALQPALYEAGLQ